MAAQADLVSWLEQHGGYVHPLLDLFSPLGNGDRGVRARAAISEGDQLLLVPKALCLYLHDESVDCKAQSDLPLLKLVRSLKLSPFFSAAVLLMALRAQGDCSKFSPFINSLPPCHDCLLGWTDEERALLGGTDLGEDKENAAASYQRHVKPLLCLHPDTWPADRCGAAEFEWACAMVQSRAFHLVGENWITSTSSEGSELYMIPGIDMINHSTQPSRRGAALKLVNQPLTVMCGEPLREVTLEGYFAMVAEREIAAGEEVLYFYGDLSDSQLLQTYGFVESWAEGESNPHNTASIPSELLLASCEAIAKAIGLVERETAAGDSGKQGPSGNRGSKGSGSSGSRKRKGREGDAVGAVAPASMAARRALLERLGLLPANANVMVLAEQPLTTGLLTIAQVMLMPPGVFVEYAAEFGAAQDPGSSAADSTKPGQARGLLGREYLDDTDFREAVCLALLKAVQARLKQYSTTMEDDEALLTQHAAAQHDKQRLGGGSTPHADETSNADKEPGGSSEGLLTWRAACAVRVRLGEKRVLLQLKQQLMELLAEGEFEDEEEEEGLSDDDDLSEDSADD